MSQIGEVVLPYQIHWCTASILIQSGYPQVVRPCGCRGNPQWAIILDGDIVGVVVKEDESPT